MEKKYLFFDLDGTLLAGGYVNTSIPDSALLALGKLRVAGHFMCIATGRSHAMARDWMRKLGFENMVSDGGNGLTINNVLVGIEPLDKAGVIDLARECDVRGIPWALQLDDSRTRVAPDGRFQEFVRDNYMETKVVPGLKPEKCEEIYKAYLACQAPVENTLEALKTLPFGRYHERCLFVEPVNKAVGIRKMLHFFGGSPRDVIVFGDSPADLTMFSPRWTNVAMGNGSPLLKEKADLVTSSLDEDGIYRACETLGLF